MGYYRNFAADDPVGDAERSQIDIRPRFSVCEQCGEPIRAACAGYYGDDYFEIVPNEQVHEECISDYLKQFKKEAIL